MKKLIPKCLKNLGNSFGNIRFTVPDINGNLVEVSTNLPDPAKGKLLTNTGTTLRTAKVEQTNRQRKVELSKRKLTLKEKDAYEQRLHPGQIKVDGIWVTPKHAELKLDSRSDVQRNREQQEQEAQQAWDKVNDNLYYLTNSLRLGDTLSSLGQPNKELALAKAKGNVESVVNTVNAATFPGQVAMALHGGYGLYDQYQGDRLGLNLETTGNTLEIVPLAFRGIGKTISTGKNYGNFIYLNLKYPMQEVKANGTLSRVWYNKPWQDITLNTKYISNTNVPVVYSPTNSPEVISNQAYEIGEELPSDVGTKMRYDPYYGTDGTTSRIWFETPRETFGQVFYYAPTMGKTTAAKTNNNLVDFDDIMRPIKERLAAERGMTKQEFMMSSNVADKEALAKEYVKEINKWRSDPVNKGKILLVSSESTLNPKYGIMFDNTPLMPSHDEFIRRGVARTEGFNILNKEELNKIIQDLEESYLRLMQLNPKFIINDRYVSDIINGGKSKLTLAERLGIPKGDRGNLSRILLDALDDLALYINSGQYRQLSSLLNGNIVWGSKREIFIPKTEGLNYKGVNIREISPNAINVSTGDGASLTTMSQGEGKLILTAPKTELLAKRQAILKAKKNPDLPWNRRLSLETEPSLQLIEKALNVVPKESMKLFWPAVFDTRRPGSYFSGDLDGQPLGSRFISIFRRFNDGAKKVYPKKFITKPEWNGDGRMIDDLTLPYKLERKGKSWKDILTTLYGDKAKWTKVGINTEGLSPDAYIALLKQGNRPGYALRFDVLDPMIGFNNTAVKNKYIYNLFIKALNGEIPKQEFIKVFNEWVDPYHGMHARIIHDEFGNEVIGIPHPFIYMKKRGGKLLKK